MTKQPIHAFTRRANGIARVLEVPVKVGLPVVDPADPPKAPPVPCNGIWDTGASGTAITRQVAEKLGLKPISRATAHTAKGQKECDVYLISVVLNDAVVVTTRAIEADLVACDVLVGMDIIGQGDFSVSNYDGRTAVSFRVPSCEDIDYAKRAQIVDQNTPKKRRPRKKH
jgi:predicted aspartyl protease